MIKNLGTIGHVERMNVLESAIKNVLAKQLEVKMAKRGRKGNPVVGVKKTGETVEYESVIAAARAVGVCRQAIANAIESGFRSGGFYWRYKR